MASAASAPSQAELSHSINALAVSLSLSYRPAVARVESAQSSAMLLLEFVEALEKNLYSAFEGCLGDSEVKKTPPKAATASPPHNPHASPTQHHSNANAWRHAREGGQVSPFQYRDIPPMSILWFHRNRKVLDEWLLRLRPALLNLSKIVGAPQFVVKHGFVQAENLRQQLHLLCVSCKQTSPASSVVLEGNKASGAATTPQQKARQHLKVVRREFEV